MTDLAVSLALAFGVGQLVQWLVRRTFEGLPAWVGKALAFGVVLLLAGLYWGFETLLTAPKHLGWMLLVAMLVLVPRYPLRVSRPEL